MKTTILAFVCAILALPGAEGADQFVTVRVFDDNSLLTNGRVFLKPGPTKFALASPAPWAGSLVQNGIVLVDRSSGHIADHFTCGDLGVGDYTLSLRVIGNPTRSIRFKVRLRSPFPADPGRATDPTVEDGSAENAWAPEVAHVPARMGTQLPSGLRGYQLSSTADSGTLSNHITYLHSLGANIVRFPIYIRLKNEDGLFHTYSLTNEWFPKLDGLIPVCERLGVILVIALHSGDAAEPVESKPFFTNWWKRIATRYTGRGPLFYDLANEPKLPIKEWRKVARETAQIIQNIDTNNFIVFSARGIKAKNVIGLKPLEGIRNQIIEFHVYDWQSQFQSEKSKMQYGEYRSYKRRHVDALLQQVAIWRDKIGVEFYIGESAIYYDKEFSGEFIRDLTDLSDKYAFPLTLHAYQEHQFWRYESNSLAWAAVTNWLSRSKFER